MNRRALRKMPLGMVLAILLCRVPALRADYVSSAPSAELSSSRSITLNSWIPYRTEFSEVKNCLESAGKFRIGSGVVLDSRLNAADFSSVSRSDCVPKPVSNHSESMKDWIDHFNRAADPGTTGTSSRPGPERNSQPQTCLLVPQQNIHVEAIAKVIADSKVIPGRPFHPDVFHPPRPSLL
jgi:hypothetical protein